MKINIISYDNGYDLSKDIFKLKSILHEIKKNLDKKTQIL